jgi:uncharacterized protein YndB with AHSA1/START domain
MTSTTDLIEKQVLLDAPLERVWRAISDAHEFGTWFGARFDGPFAAGTHLTGRIQPTAVDPEIAEGQEPYEGLTFHITVERIEPMRLVSFRWHPYAVDPEVDYSKDPTTLVVFELEETPDGTLLTIRESGFDEIPLSRRAEAFEMNEEGWEAQVTLIRKYLADGS